MDVGFQEVRTSLSVSSARATVRERHAIHLHGTSRALGSRSPSFYTTVQFGGHGQTGGAFGQRPQSLLNPPPCHLEAFARCHYRKVMQMQTRQA